LDKPFPSRQLADQPLPQANSQGFVTIGEITEKLFKETEDFKPQQKAN